MKPIKRKVLLIELLFNRTYGSAACAATGLPRGPAQGNEYFVEMTGAGGGCGILQGMRLCREKPRPKRKSEPAG